MFASHIHRREGGRERERERGKRKGGKIQPLKYLHKGVIYRFKANPLH
jgi:hypothetical protein